MTICMRLDPPQYFDTDNPLHFIYVLSQDSRSMNVEHLDLYLLFPVFAQHKNCSSSSTGVYLIIIYLIQNNSQPCKPIQAECVIRVRERKL